MSDKKKLKVFVISDHVLAPSGVGTQTNYMIKGLLATGDYQFVCFGGAIKHENYRPLRFNEFGEDLSKRSREKNWNFGKEEKEKF